jgi:hypothetical protein
VSRASGVFLWANLIVRELIGAFEGDQVPTLQDLLQLLKSFPVELSEYCRFIVERIPKNLRWKT